VLLIYVLVGAVLCAVTATIAGLFYSYWLSLVLSLIYFIVLIVLIFYTQYKQNFFEQRFLINLALILQSINIS